MLPTMSEIRELRPIVPPLLLGWLATVLTAWLTVPLVDAALAGASVGAAPVVRVWMWVVAALAPLIQTARASIWVAATWGLLTLASRVPPLRGLLSLFLYGELVHLLHGVLLALFFQWSIEPGSVGVDFLDPLSLGAYVPSSHGPWSGLVKQLSLAQAAWVVYVGVAARRVLELGTKGAWTLAFTLWLGGVAVATTRVLMNG